MRHHRGHWPSPGSGTPCRGRKPFVTETPIAASADLIGRRSKWRAIIEIMLQSTLRSSRIELVPLGDEHIEYEVELDSDPAVMRYLGNGQPRTRALVEEYHRRRIEAAARVAGLGFWAGFVDGRFVGWWIWEPPERADQGPVQGQAELGYRLLRRYWRQGLASEGARELIRHGFEDLELDRIFAETMAVNAASRATMTSSGLRHLRTFHIDWDEPIPGSEHGEVEYAITRNQWIDSRLTTAPRPN